MNLAAWAKHHRTALLGGGAVAGLAGYVWYRHRATQPPAAAAATPAAGSVATGGALGAFDSTGTDVAAWLGNYSGSLQNQLNEFGQQLTDALGGLQQPPVTPPPSSTSTGAAAVHTVPSPAAPAPLGVLPRVPGR